MIDSYKDFDRKNPNWLYAEDLNGKRVTVTITDMNAEAVTSDKDAEEKVSLTLKDKKKRLLLNVTNLRRLKRLFGKDPKNAIGKEITIEPTTVEAFGADVDAIRIVGSPLLKEPVKHLEQKGRKKTTVMLIPTGQAAPA